MLVRVVARQMLGRERTWADRCRDLPAAMALATEQRRSAWGAPAAIPAPLRPSCLVGLRRKESPAITTEMFETSPSCKLATYLRIIQAYQEISTSLDQMGDIHLDPAWGLKLALQLAHDAHLLYLLEVEESFHDLHPDSEALDAAVLKECVARAEFIAAKDAEYGQAIRYHGIPGAMVRLWDKIARFSNLKDKNLPTKFESMADSLRDLGGYTLILAGLFQEALEDPHEGGSAHPLAWHPAGDDQATPSEEAL